MKPEVSVITIAKDRGELKPLIEALKQQTFKDWEFVYSTKKGIPQAWNDATQRAKGKIFIITESDALPLNNKWLKEMVHEVKTWNTRRKKRDFIIRGMEIHPLPWCFCNIGCYGDVMRNHKLNEKLSVGEDTDLFARLASCGYIGVEVRKAPVLHSRKFKGFKKEVKNAFTYGMVLSIIQRQQGRLGFYDNKKKDTNILVREITFIVSRICFLIGAVIGRLT